MNSTNKRELWNLKDIIQNNIFNSMEKGEIKEITRRINKKVSEVCKKVLIDQLKGD